VIGVRDTKQNSVFVFIFGSRFLNYRFNKKSIKDLLPPITYYVGGLFGQANETEGLAKQTQIEILKVLSMVSE